MWCTPGVGRPSWDSVTVYAAIMGTSYAGMYERDVTVYVSESGNETFDYSVTSNNEVYLLYLNDDYKNQAEANLNAYMYAGKINSVDKLFRPEFLQ